MTKIQELARRNVVFGVVAALLLVYLVLRPDTTSAVGTEDLPKLFPALELEGVRQIELSRAGEGGALQPGGESLRLVREDDDAWVVASKGGYPAEASKVTAFLEDLLGARRKKIVTEREEAFGEYAGVNGWTEVTVLDAMSKPVASFAVGKTARWPDSYVKLDVDGKPRVIRAHNLRADRARLTVADWSEARLWPGLAVDDVTQVDVLQRDEKQTLSFKRVPASETAEEEKATEGEGAAPSAPEAPDAWRMVVPKSEVAERAKVENLVRAFTGMRMADLIATEDIEEAALGLDKPTYRVVAHLRAETEGGEERLRILKIGQERLDEEGEGTGLWPVQKDGDPWVFLVRTSGIADFRLPADDFLPPPPEEETPPPADAAPADGDDPAEGSPDGD